MSHKCHTDVGETWCFTVLGDTHETLYLATDSDQW
jgi:hypothetical protein